MKDGSRQSSPPIHHLVICLAIALGLGGCANLGQWAVRKVVPRVVDRAKKEINPPEPVSERWRRLLRTADGSRVDPETFDGSQPVIVLWESNLPRRKSGEGAWVGIETSCPSPRPPTAWSAAPVPGGGTSRRGDLWRVVEKAPDNVTPHEDGRRELSAVHVLPVLEYLHLTLEDNVRWILYLPEDGEYGVAQAWGGVDAARALSVRPCPIRWTPIPMPELIRMTRYNPAKGSNGQMVWGQGDPEVKRAERLLGFVGSEAYDLMQLHNAALAYETGGALPSGVSEEMVRHLRRPRVDALAESEKGLSLLCELGVRRHLFVRPLRLWNGDTTIPQSLAPACRKRYR